uniref:DNA-directed DNA polymerase n=1 Tax=Panagrolaimus superbus TaxID=310955 RepID=A0A914YRA8_9BILA
MVIPIPQVIPYSGLMWRQTLRFVSYRGAGAKSNYGHQVLHSQSHQPNSNLQHTITLNDFTLPEISNDKKPVQKSTSNSSLTYDKKVIELVPSNIHEYLFPNAPTNDKKAEEVSDEILKKIILPELNASVEKNGLMAHFDEIGKEQFASYEELLEIAAAIENPPKMPLEWSFTAGWTKYDTVTGKQEAVEFPNEKVLFFDVEVCVPESKLACLAVAMSPTSWYSWCSDRLVNDSEVPKLTRIEHMIPLEKEKGSKEPKIVIGHNVGFDRARVREQYYQDKTGTRFWDTMSMNIAVFGMAEHQRLIYEKTDLKEDFAKHNKWVPAWRQRVSKNSLGAVHSKLCGEKTSLKLNKSMQHVFVKENIDVIREHFQSLTQYCAEDVLATFEVFKELYPIFRERFPHPITYVGMMEMGSAYLPITENWRLFYEKCNQDTAEVNDRAARGLAQASLDIAKDLSSENKYETDPWMWICEWEIHKKLFKPKWYLNLFSTTSAAPVEEDENVSATDIKFRCRDVPRVFGICYGPFPLHHKAAYGWGYLVPNFERSQNCPDIEKVKVRRGDIITIPNKAIMDLVAKNRAEGFPELPLPPTPDATVGVFDFYRLPHPKTPGENVGSPFTKDNLKHFEADLLRATRYTKALTDYLSTLVETRFWTNYKERFNDEITVWFGEDAKIGAIAPAIVPAGTVTRRATHKLWLTSTSPKEKIIGTNLKSMIECTEGWKIVGADVDSQEQWLAALLGDYVTGEGKAGATAFANMLLAGSKSDNSDLHSVVARQVGIDRDNAKVLNYARLYGAGKNHAIEFLKQQAFVEENAARNYSEKLFSTTKGVEKTYYELNPDLIADFHEFLQNECPKKYEEQHIRHQGRLFLPVYRHTDGQVSHLFEDYMKQKCNINKNSLQEFVLFMVKLYPNYPNQVSLFKDGFESDTFNFLEIKALEDCPRTPLLGCRLSQALEALPPDVPDADLFRRKFKRSVINWVIQSSAVDFLHMLLVCMKWLCEKYEIDARFVLSIHDEIRYMVPDEDKYRCALALTLSNMYVRAAISQKLGINELPKSIAFFSQVDVDTVLRKEVNQKCKTPDGRNIPFGEALNMENIIEKTGGTLEKKQ